MGKYAVLLFAMFFVTACSNDENKSAAVTPLDSDVIETVITDLIDKHGSSHTDRITRGVKQVASLWRVSDGDKMYSRNFAAIILYPTRMNLTWYLIVLRITLNTFLAT